MDRVVRSKCIDISSEGKGVVKCFKDVIFVDGLFPGEEADIEYTYKRAGVWYGKIRKLYTTSKSRIQPRCKICTACGGCQYQQLAYPAQLEIKAKRVKEALERIGHLKCEVSPCVGMDEPYNYRNKIQVPFGKDPHGKIVFGFYKQNTHQIIPVKECAIEDKRASSILWDIKSLIEELNIPVYNEDSGRGILRHVLIRTSYHYKEVMVVLVTTTLNFPRQRNLVDALTKKHPEITSIVENVNSRDTNVILGEKEKVLFGKKFIKDDILDLTFEISASSFFQINPVQVEKLYKTAISFINDGENKVLLDAYSGVGTIGLIASKSVKSVISVELNKDAHKNGIDNAKRNNINNIKFVNDDASDFINNYDGDIDIVIMDPPRKGSDEKFLSSLINKKIKEVIYISCNPETLARDLAFLSEYYEIKNVVPVDMFPFTSHVETVACLRLKER